MEYLEFNAGKHVFRVPSSGYYFNNTDCWARIEGPTAKIGLSDLIRRDPRQILAFDPPEEGLRVAIFDGLCSFKTDRVSLDVYSPVTGKVLSSNPALAGNPGLVKEDPYERGWVVEVELTDIEDDLAFLTDPERYLADARARIEIGPLRGCPCSRRVRKASL